MGAVPIVPCQHPCPQGSDEGAWRTWGSGGLRTAVNPSEDPSPLSPGLSTLCSCTLHLGQSWLGRRHLERLDVPWAWELFPQPFLWARRDAGLTSPFPRMTLWLWFFPRACEEPVGISLLDTFPSCACPLASKGLENTAVLGKQKPSTSRCCCLDFVSSEGWAWDGLFCFFVFKGFSQRKKKTLAVFHPNTSTGRGSVEGEAAWLTARKNADSVRELSWEKSLFLKRRAVSFEGFLLLSLRQKILLQLLTVPMHSSLLWRGFASL